MATTDLNGQWVVELHGKIVHYHYDMDAAIKHAEVLNAKEAANKLLALELAQGR